MNEKNKRVFYLKFNGVSQQQKQILRRPFRQGIEKASNENEDRQITFGTAVKTREETLFPKFRRTA